MSIRILHLEDDPNTLSRLSDIVQMCGGTIVHVQQIEAIFTQLRDNGIFTFVLVNTELGRDRSAKHGCSRRIKQEYPGQLVFGTSFDTANRSIYENLGCGFIDKSRLLSEVPRLLDCVGGRL